MTAPRVFRMGEYRAEFPADRHYADNHMWALPVEIGWRFGLAAYAVRLLQDVYFLDWSVEADTDLIRRQEIGSIESKKAESALYSPIAGRLVGFNAQLLRDPSAINVDPYERGWLFEMAPAGAPALMTADDYVIYLASIWEKTQQTIKGQLNQ